MDEDVNHSFGSDPLSHPDLVIELHHYGYSLCSGGYLAWYWPFVAWKYIVYDGSHAGWKMTNTQGGGCYQLS